LERIYPHLLLCMQGGEKAPLWPLSCGKMQQRPRRQAKVTSCSAQKLDLPHTSLWPRQPLGHCDNIGQLPATDRAPRFGRAEMEDRRTTEVDGQAALAGCHHFNDMRANRAVPVCRPSSPWRLHATPTALCCDTVSALLGIEAVLHMAAPQSPRMEIFPPPDGSYSPRL
jgi:hypothetical protein